MTQNTYKEGDTVKCILYSGEWTLAWYKEKEHTCAIQNSTRRLIVNVKTLIPLKKNAK